MKIFLVPLAALAVLAFAPTPTRGGDTTDTAKVTRNDNLRQRFCDVCDELARKAVARNATRENYNRAVDAVRALANEHTADHRQIEAIQLKLIDRINELELRAKTVQLKLVEFDVLKDISIDLELLGCLGRMANMCREGKATRLDFAMCYEALTLRAETAKLYNSPEIDAVIGRLRDQIAQLEKRAKDATQKVLDEELVPPFQTYADATALVAVERLSKRALELRLTVVPQDYMDVQDPLLVAGIKPTAEFYKNVAYQLDVLRNAVVGGRITRAEFVTLRDLLMQRARAAASGA
jgi:hypothetical protein